MRTSGKLALRYLFEIGQRFGLDILPRHFYSEVPDIRQLRSDLKWREPFSMQGIAGSLNDQLAFTRHCVSPFEAVLSQCEIHKTAVAMNGSDEGYGKLEADFLYSFVRRHRPHTIIQVGSGVSTAVCLLAAAAERYTPKIISIDPYPTNFLKQSADSGAIELVAVKVQDLDAGFFDQLKREDLFFVDSSHALGPGGEVSRIILSILPALAPGVFVHFHDIWFPYDYCPHILESDLFFMHETPLLYAFLCMNQRYTVAASLSQLFHQRQADLQACFPRMQPAEFSHGLMIRPGDYPGAIYLRS